MPKRKTDDGASSGGAGGPRRGAMRRPWVVAGAVVLGLVVAGAVLLATRPRPSAANAESSASAQHSVASTGLIVGPVADLDLARDYTG